MTDTLEPIYLMKGHTIHVRRTPFEHKFRYGVTLIDVDVDHLERANLCSKIFSVGRKNFVSLDTDKRGAGFGGEMAGWARETFASAGLDCSGHSIRLITFPTTEFYSFAPISIWLLLKDSERVVGVIYEVNNTFGERHSYVAKLSASDATHEAEKNFHVSPFFSVDGKYAFDLKHSRDHVSLKITGTVAETVNHVATLQLRRCPATTPGFVALLLKTPFSAIGVSVAIHWEAFKLFLKGARYYPRPKLPARDVTFTKNKGRQTP